MQFIPKPELLDPDRVIDNDRGDFTVDHEARAQLLETALRDSCGYADQLWQDLNSMRRYLIDCLPPPSPGAGPLQQCAAPTGPDDDEGWQRWVDAFAEVNSVLCGSHGDSGYGLSAAREEERKRRSQLDVPSVAESSPGPQPEVPTGTEPATSVTSPSTRTAAPAPPPTRRNTRAAAIAVLGVVALRGLRPRRGGEKLRPD